VNVVVVTFIRDGQMLARLGVAYGQPVQSEGDCSWIDYTFAPRSARLQRPVSFQEDAEEWARSLPGAYVGSGLVVEAAETVPAAIAALPPPAPSPIQSLGPQRTRKVPALVRAAVTVAALLAVLFVGPKITKDFHASAPAGAAVTPASYLVAVRPAKVSAPAALALAQARTLVSALVNLSQAGRATVTCSSEATSQTPSCLLPDFMAIVTAGTRTEAAFAQSEDDVSNGVCRTALDHWRIFLPTLLAYTQEGVIDAQADNVIAFNDLVGPVQAWDRQEKVLDKHFSLAPCLPADITTPSAEALA
jgi:hypothetical protein